MSLEAQPGAEPSPALETSPKLGATTKASPRYPVARPAPKLPRIKGGAEPEKADLVEDLLSPPSIRGFAWSVAGHALFLLMLAFWYFAPPLKPQAEFDTRMAGSEFGDPSGTQITGGLGMDTPLALPLAPEAPAESSAVITSMPMESLALPAIRRPEVSGASNGGGVNLSHPGQAGNGDGFGVAKFGQGGENINGVEVKVGDPQFTLIWDSRADIDLHVIEPGGSEIYWENRNGGQGGELDVDDIDGFGPENINYGQNLGAPGTYRWFVHYYGGLGGIAQRTRWKVRIKHAGKVDLEDGAFTNIGQKSQIFELKIRGQDVQMAPVPAQPAAPAPAPTAVATAPAPVAAPASAPAAPLIGPRTFEPPGGGFSLVLPGDPRAGRKEWTTPVGTIVARTYSLDKASGGWAIATLDFPTSALAGADKDKLLDDLAKLAYGEYRGVETKKTSVGYRGFPGREVEFVVPAAIVAGGGNGRLRVYLAGSRAVVVAAVGSKAFVAGSEVFDAFGSLKVSEVK